MSVSIFANVYGKMNLMKYRLKIFLSIGILLVLYAFYYFGIPAILNVKNNVRLIKKIVKQETNLDIELTSPRVKMGLLPAMWLEADNFKIVESSSIPFNIDSPKIKLELIPLIFKHINLKYFYGNNISADIKIDKQGLLYIGNYQLIKKENAKISLDNAKLNAYQYSIKIKDERYNKNILLDGKYFIVDKFNPQKYINFSTDSILTIDNVSSYISARVNMLLPVQKSFKSEKLLIQGLVTNLNLNLISPYIKELTNGEVKHCTGIVNIASKTEAFGHNVNKFNTNFDISNGEILFNKIGDKITFPKKTSVISESLVSKHVLKINKFDVISTNLKLSLSGRIKNPEDNNPTLDLKIKLYPSRSEEIVNVLPIVKFKDVDFSIEKLKKYGLFADIEGYLDIYGKLKKVLLDGQIVASNAYVYKPLNIPRATIKAIFKKDRLNLDVEVPAGNSQTVWVKGDIAMYNKNDIKLEITSTQNVNLETAETVLLPVHEVVGFPIGPVPIMDIKGLGGINLTTYGAKGNPSLFGEFWFKNATVSFNDIKNCELTNGEGDLKFEDKIMHFSTKKAYLDAKPIKVDGTCTVKGVLDFDVIANSVNLNKVMQILKTSPMLEDFKKSTSYVSATSGNIALKLKLKGTAKNIEDFKLGDSVNVSGDIKLLNNDFIISGIYTRIRNVLGNIHFKNSNVDFDLYPNISNKRYQFKGKYDNGKIYSKFNLAGLSFVYHKMPVKFQNGAIELDGDRLYLKKVNGVVDSKPIFIDGSVNNILQQPALNVYVNSKPVQSFIDKYLNKKNIYPLIVKGDINYSAHFSGPLNDLNVKSNVKLQEDSSIYYLGAMIGDSINPIRLNLDCNLKNYKVLTLNNFQYDKVITSQNNHSYLAPQLNAKGTILLSKNMNFDDLRIRTFTPTDAKIFNILFKKIIIKQGVFNSNIIVNGAFPNIKILGKLDLNNVSVPFLDTTIKSINLNFRERIVDFKLSGEVLSQAVHLSGAVHNSLNSPHVIEQIFVESDDINLNQISRKLNNLVVESDINGLNSLSKKNTINLNDFQINNMKIKAKKVKLRKITATNASTELSFKKGILDVSKFSANVAQGVVTGLYKHNYNDSKTHLDLKVSGVDANEITDYLLDLPNQLYGSLFGELNITYKGDNPQESLKTLNGKGGFRVANGRMPKLGSLEYLLRAANLVKSGITGLTLNSLIDLVTPLKTGQFENINGFFNIHNGVAQDVQIFSKGKNLSIFISGEYNCNNSIADLHVFGRVSKKITTKLGVIGNTSLNTLFNTIPGINLDDSNKTSFIKNLNKIPGFELNDKTYRIFSATIKGNLNSDNYVQSFKWVE